MSRPSQEDKHLAGFGKNIKRIRTARGMTQDQLAYKSGLTIETIGAIERGIRWARLTTLHKLAKAMDVKIEELFKGLS